MSQRNAESGFSLIELVIALVVTLVITGAMWGLLAGGQSAFRREPELMDRQQAIRLGMDRVVADVALAGQRMRLDTQAFAPGLNAAGMAGPRGLAGSPGATDELEIRTTYDCPELIVERTNGVEIDIAGTLPSCYRPETPILLIYPDGSSQIGWVDKVTGAGGGGGQNSVSIPPAQAPPYPLTDIQKQEDIDTPTVPTRVTGAQIVRYVIAPDTTADALPSLWRSDIGGYSYDAGAVVDPGGAADGGWRLVARGVEDLQVRYRYPSCGGADQWCNEPPVAAGDILTTVTEVEIRLGARTAEANLAGATTSLSTTAFRGQLVTVVSPRAALANVAQLDPTIWQ